MPDGNDARITRWANAFSYIPYVLIGALILWGYTQCEATKEARKENVWRYDWCYIGQVTAEKRCIKSSQLYSKTECEEMAAGAPSLPGFVSAECIESAKDPQYPWKPASN